MLLGIYSRPGRVFEVLKEKPSWLVPLLVVVALSVAAMYITRPVVIPEILSEMAKNPDIPPEGLEKAQQMVQNPWLGLIEPVAGTAVKSVLIALAFWGLFAMIGGKSPFKLIFTAVAWSWMVKIPEQIIKVPLILIQETARVHTSLVLVLPVEMEKTFIYRLLAQIDIFNIWMVALLALGCSSFSGVDRKKAQWASFAAWGGWVLLFSWLAGKLHPGG
jgi:hypothetical protein